MNFDTTGFMVLYGGPSASPIVIWLMIVFTTIGSGYTLGLLLPLLLPRFRVVEPIRYLLASVVATSVVVFVLKHLVGRTRPWQTLHVIPLFQRPTDHSFPSGHASGAFTVLGFLMWAGSGPDAPRGFRRARNVALFVAPMVAISRVYLGVHYPGDVTVGALLGLGIGSAGGLFYRRSLASKVPSDPK